MADEGKRGIQGELFHIDTGHEPGENNWKGFGFDVNPPVFLIGGGVIVLFIVLSLLFPDTAGEMFNGARETLGEYFAWFFILGVNIIIIFMIYLAISKYGNIRLGGVDGVQEYSDISWIAMLFSAGMGIGLMFYGVAEPIWHYQMPHLGAEPLSQASAEVALGVSLYHWGVHPWAVYALVALSLAFFSYNRGLPLTFRSIFWPVLGERIYGWGGHVIDILTIFATLFGLVTSLGLGALQINRGLNYMGESIAGFPAIPFSVGTQVVLIMIITAIASVSVYLGIDKGIRRLSNVNLFLMITLLVATIILGPTMFILEAIPQGIGAYLSNLVELSFFSGAIEGPYFQGHWYAPDGGGAGTFLTDWTVFYWAWWIAWSPFVGMFIARISKGRNIREFIGGVMMIPVILSFVWFSALGGSALKMELDVLQATGEAGGPVMTALNELGLDVAMFAMFEQFPGTVFLSSIAIILVTTFFVTSSDSGSLVLDHLSSGGKHKAAVGGRVFWAASEGLVAIALLVAGGDQALNALQAAAITSGLPFLAILLFMIYAIWKGLAEEVKIMRSEEFRDRIDELRAEEGVVVESSQGEIVTGIHKRDEDTVVEAGD
ncbi:MAG: BCCT family transporter [Halodesulfurarchaeum sp.]|nr:BCCT family transporter [Halodesulfurarchaeum sp.]